MRSRTNGGQSFRRMSVARRITCWSRIVVFPLIWEAPSPPLSPASIDADFEMSGIAACTTPIERKIVSKPLTDIRVLDLSKVLAGPLCAQYLGDLGADIIKLETLGQDDEIRGGPPSPPPALLTFFPHPTRNNPPYPIPINT